MKDVTNEIKNNQLELIYRVGLCEYIELEKAFNSKLAAVNVYVQGIKRMEGISDTDIGKYLGHKKNNVTMDVYIDLTKSRQQQIVNIIDIFIK